MDELIEAFSVINQMEKGALGLFFELNYLIGLFLTVYITWFVNTFTAVPLPYVNTTDAAQKKALLGSAKYKAKAENYENMYNWLYVNYIYLYVCLFVAMIVACIYKSMNAKAKQLAKVN